MKNLVIASVFCFVGTLVVSCVPAATDGEIAQMCENLVGLRADGPLPVEKDLLARVEEDFKAREKKLVDWRAKDLKGWDDELAAKLEKAENDEEKAKLNEDYAKKKEVTSKQFDPDFQALGPSKEAAIKEAKKKVVDEKAERDEEIKKCVTEAKNEGISQKVAQCRIKADSTDAYWNQCR